MKKILLAQLLVYREGNDPLDRVTVDGDMNYLGQGIAASMVQDDRFADTIIAAIDFYRLKHDLTFAQLAKFIEHRVKLLTDPGKTTAT